MRDDHFDGGAANQADLLPTQNAVRDIRTQTEEKIMLVEVAEIRKRLAHARGALDAADTRSTQLEASKLESSKTPETFSAWQTESTTNETEKSRLRYLIPLIE